MEPPQYLIDQKEKHERENKDLVSPLRTLAGQSFVRPPRGGLPPGARWSI
jgi:hypothetical protein